MAAIINLNSRFVLNWSVSNSMEAEWCWNLFNETVAMYGKPDIINTDQCSQYTSDIFTSAVLSRAIRLSMDGKGRATGLLFFKIIPRIRKLNILIMAVSTIVLMLDFFVFLIGYEMLYPIF